MGFELGAHELFGGHLHSPHETRLPQQKIKLIQLPESALLSYNKL